MLPIDRPLLALFAMALCFGLAWACLCRLNAMSKDTTRPLIRASYAVLFTDAVAVASMPVWLPETWAEVGVVCLVAGYLLVMVSNTRGWLHGPPAHARSTPMDLDGPLERTFETTEPQP